MALAVVLLSVARSRAAQRGWAEVVPSARNAPAVVRATQYLLREHGYTLAVDGRYGAQTQRCVRRFQIKSGLPKTGVVDSDTWERLIIPARRGARGNAVRGAQSLLRALAASRGESAYRVALDGVFSAKTERAVRRFQKDVSVPSDGLVGPVTWNYLINNAALD